MLDRIHGLIIFECDGPKCLEVLEPETTDFSEALEALREANWTARFSAPNWLHICPACLEAETLEVF